MAARDNLGQQWDYPNVENVPVNVLAGMRGNPLRYDVSDLSKDIKERGIQEPLIVGYFQKSKKAILEEGNHRLEAAIQAGMTHVPTRVFRANSEGRPNVGQVVKGVEPDRFGYVKGDLRMSEITDWED